MATTISFPGWANTPIKKLSWIHRAEEKLRLLRNKMGNWKRDGYSQAEHDALPAKIRGRYPYVANLADTQWDDYISTWKFGYNKIRYALDVMRNTVTPQIRQDNTIAVDLESEIS